MLRVPDNDLPAFAGSSILPVLVVVGGASVGGAIIDAIGVTTTGVILAKTIEWWIINKTAKDYAPVKFDPYNPGKDSSGRCIPKSFDGYKWRGTTGTPHWHWLRLDQNPVTCVIFATKGSGPSDPGPGYIEVAPQ